MSEAFSAASEGSTSDSNKPDTASCGNARRMSGADASSQPDSQESNAAPTSEEYDDSLTPWLPQRRRIHSADGEHPTLASGGKGPRGNSLPWMSSVEGSHAKTSASPADEPDSSREAEAACSSSAPASQMNFYDQEDGSSLRTYPDSFPVTVDAISASFSRRWPTSGSMTSLGACWTHDSSESPSGGGVSSSLRDVLEATVPDRYFLSPRAARGILRRAEARGRELPTHLLLALREVAGMGSTPRKPREAS